MDDPKANQTRQVNLISALTKTDLDKLLVDFGQVGGTGPKSTLPTVAFASNFADVTPGGGTPQAKLVIMVAPTYEEWG